MYKTIIYLGCVGLLVFMFVLLLKSASGRSRLLSRIFASTTLLTALWAVCLWIADTTESLAVARASLNIAVFFLTLVTWLLLFFAISYPNRVTRNFSVLFFVAIIYNIVFFALTISQQIITHVSISTFGASIERATAMYTIHVVQSTLFIVASLVFLNVHRKKLTAVERSRINFMSLGILIALVGNGLSGVVSTYAEGLSWLNLIATTSTVLFVLVIGYAIMKHRLFDVRYLVVRSTTYLLLVLLFGAVFAVVFFGVIVNIPGQSEISRFQQFVYVVMVISLALVFQPLKRVFDRITNRYFYQDAYDGQVLIDELNQALVATIDLDRMLKQSIEILERNIKPDFCLFGLRETEYEDYRIVGSVRNNFDYHDIRFAQSGAFSLKHKIIVTDYLEDSDKEVRDKMRKNDIAAIVRLTSDVSSEGVGFIALGEKKSGGMYNSQDTRVLEIVANSLVIAIENALRFEEIQNFNVTLEQKVEDATRKLRQTNEKLKLLDQTKDEFISMASHQLRTPLTAVKGYVSLVVEGDAGQLNKKQKELLTQAFMSSQRMVYLIADLLNISRLRSGKFNIENKKTDLVSVVETELDQLAEAARTKNQKITFIKPESFPVLMLDETKIRQVIMNFSDNALHYTPAGGAIELKLEDRGKSIEFTVNDDGLGVPKIDQHQLFTKFFRAGNAKKTRPDGTGLGLFMAKKVIIAQGGAVIFKSQEGKGSTFGFTIPKAGKVVYGSDAVSGPNAPKKATNTNKAKKS